MAPYISSMHMSGRSQHMKRWIVLLGVIGVVVVLVLLFPIGCGSTDPGIPPGGPDPNAASCSTLLFEERGSTPGGDAATDEEFTSVDLVWRRIAVRAVAVAGIFVMVALVARWLVEKHTRRQLR